MDQFLAELQISGERSHFAVDWARAREKMGAHLDLEAHDYACHFAQLAYHLGASKLQLTVSGDWLEWSCDGRELDEAKMRATAAGELLMAELDVCLNFCLHGVLLSGYVEKIFCSGGWQLQHNPSGWKLRRTQTQGTRLQLRVAWKSRVRNFLSSAWWRKLPELQRLHPRLLASPLQLQTPQPLPRPSLPLIVEIQGQAALSAHPPAQEIVRLEYSGLTGSCWLAFQGGECHILSQGLTFPAHPFLPGRLWLALGDPPTDLGRRQLVLNADFQLARSHFLRQLSRHFGEWLEHPQLLQAGVREWLLGCLLTVADLEGGFFRESLAALPLLPTLYHGHLSLLELDERVPQQGCPVVGPCEQEELEEKPFMLVAQEVRLLAFLRVRYGEAVKSGEERLTRLRRWLHGPRLNLSPLQLYAHHWPLEFEGWQGAVAFDPSGATTRLDCYRQGRLLVELGFTRGLVRGFWVVADHPQMQMDLETDFPVNNAAWQALGNWLKKWQVVWLAEVFAKTEIADRFEIMERVLDTEGLTLGPLLKVELWPQAGFTLEGWLVDGQRQDLRRWVDAGIPFSDSMGFMLAKKFGQDSYHDAFALAEGYADRIQQWLARPEEELSLPAGGVVELQADFPLRLALSDQPGIRLRCYRRGRLLVDQVIDSLYGLPQGLLVAAQHDKFRLALRAPLLDLECEGFHLLLAALHENLRSLLEASLPRARALSLAALENLPRSYWPGRAPLLECLDGTPVTLGEALRALEPRVLVRAVAQVVLPGFEVCWRLTAGDLDWLQRAGRLRCIDVTAAYNEAYRVLCYESQAGEGQASDELPAWREPQLFQISGLHAQAGLVWEPGPAHLCETLFRRGGRPAMRCLIKLAPRQGRDAQEKLVCRVDWEELPFVESYQSLLALPEVEALVNWLRQFSFQPPLECCDFLLARLELEGPDSALWDAPLLGTSPRQLSQPGPEIVFGEEEALPSGVLRIPAGALEGLQRLLPQRSWRHWRQPPTDQPLKQALLRQAARAPRLPEGAYVLRGQGPLWIWGVAEALTGWSAVRVLYQGRPAGVIQPDWDLEIAAEVLVDELHLTAEGEVCLFGELQRTLAELCQEIRASLLRDLPRPARLRLAMLWLLRGRVPSWGAGLPDLEAVAQWWQLPGPRPYVFGANTVAGALQMPPAVVGWAQLQGLDLRNCTQLAEALAAAEVCQPPAADFELRGPGFYLSASLSASHTSVREVSGRRLLEEKIHRSFPPYYLERERPDWQESQAVPGEAFGQLWDWWREQLQQPPERLDWLMAMDPLLEVAEPGAEWLLAEARSRLRWLQEHNQDEWRLLRRGLELLGAEPIRLIVGEQGPLFQVQGRTARLNRLLAGPPSRPGTAALLSLAAHELVTLYSVPRVLSMLQ